MHRKKKQAITLLEIMIVIFLIGLIGSVVGYNVKGSLDEGRAFRTEQGAAQIKDILLLEVAKGTPIATVVEKKEVFLQSSGLVKDAKKLLKDGWGEPYVIKSIRHDTDISVVSERLKTYKKHKKEKQGSTEVEEETDESEES